MRKFLIVAFCALLASAGIAEDVVTTPWVTTITTNDLNQITKVVSRTTNGVEQTVCLVWNGTTVPIQIRGRFMSLSDEEKGFALTRSFDYTPWTSGPTPMVPQYPKKSNKDSTDKNLTDQVYEVKARW